MTAFETPADSAAVKEKIKAKGDAVSETLEMKELLKTIKGQ